MAAIEYQSNKCYYEQYDECNSDYIGISSIPIYKHILC